MSAQASVVPCLSTFSANAATTVTLSRCLRNTPRQAKPTTAPWTGRFAQSRCGTSRCRTASIPFMFSRLRWGTYGNFYSVCSAARHRKQHSRKAASWRSTSCETRTALRLTTPGIRTSYLKFHGRRRRHSPRRGVDLKASSHLSGEIRVAPEHIAAPGFKLGLAVRSPVSAFRWCHENRLADEKKIFGRVRANPSKSDLHRTRSTTHTASGMLEVTPRVTAGTPGRRDRILPGYEGRGPRS